MHQYIDGLVEIYKRVLQAADARKGIGSAQPGGPQLEDHDVVMVEILVV